MFMKFENQETRKEKYGSAFLELAYCKLDNKATIKKKLKIKNLPNWQNDSLYIYVDDLDRFFSEYNKVFGITYDELFSVRYYSTEEVSKIIERLDSEKPTQFQILVNWLSFAMTYNGFYILGI